MAGHGGWSGAVDPASILIVKPSSFGDVIHTLPAVARLKQAWPQASLAWVINPEWAPLLEDNPSVNEIVRFPRGEFRGLAGGARFLSWCRENIAVRKPDLAVDFQGLLRSAWIVRSSRARRRVGMSDAREGARWFYDKMVRVPPGVPHAVERYMATAEGVLHGYGKDFDDGSAEPPIFPLPPGDPPDGVEELPPGRFVLLHPFARGQGKSLSTAQIQEICRRLAPERVVLVGRCVSDHRPPWLGHCVDLLNATTLKQLIWLIRRANSVVTVDSGPSHLAAALERPMVAIHTWSDPRRVGPYREDAWIWKNGQLLQFRQLRDLDETFFQQPATSLSVRDLDAIARLATSF